MKDEEKRENAGILEAPVEEREIDAEVEASAAGDEQPVFRGTPIVYGELSDPIWNFREKLEVGAAKRAVAKCDVVANIGHEDLLLLGRTTSAKVGPNGERSLVLTDDERGVHIVNYPPKTDYAANLAELLRRKEIKKMSFRFKVPKGKDRWEGTLDEPIRVVTEIFPLIDVAFVAFPAYPQTKASVSFRDALEEADVDYEALRTVYAKARLGLSFSSGEARFLTQARKILGGFVPEVLFESGDSARVREIERLRLELDMVRASLSGLPTIY